ncbi:type 1 glutamine amidotransferase domain-containing protein [Levilactobacillus suantsaii]|uniref:Type 1 glutamine amidotransferase n=1 Tax=Levilactobacillus suantsaii TaxID=2292255 RepID=A0A4Q0VHK8_9LACO|nr:type 1 glutamine amidotransferase domain-containing protein [Levilactobacillus suantsaii]QMU08065.1 type 1 glutamine amidotransferase [Levilactobacillus suantsaii]RXI76761.1 type 1 glutamine amidotransferase [Levilactobacillus suantsaii]
MSQVLAIMTNDVEDIEYTSPAEALEAAGHHVTLVEDEANKTLTGKHGTTFTTEKGIDDISVADYDALLIPGGFSPDQLRADDRYVALVKDFFLADKPVFSICHGPQLFIQTGLVKGRTLTAYTTVRPDLYYAGGIVKDEPVVIDRHLITSRTPDDLPQFNAAITKELA